MCHFTISDGHAKACFKDSKALETQPPRDRRLCLWPEKHPYNTRHLCTMCTMSSYLMYSGGSLRERDCFFPIASGTRDLLHWGRFAYLGNAASEVVCHFGGEVLKPDHLSNRVRFMNVWHLAMSTDFRYTFAALKTKARSGQGRKKDES